MNIASCQTKGSPNKYSTVHTWGSPQMSMWWAPFSTQALTTGSPKNLYCGHRNRQMYQFTAFFLQFWLHCSKICSSICLFIFIYSHKRKHGWRSNTKGLYSTLVVQFVLTVVGTVVEEFGLKHKPEWSSTLMLEAWSPFWHYHNVSYCVL